jgi:hypothetical protein
MSAKPAIKDGAESHRKKPGAPERLLAASPAASLATLRDALWLVGSPSPLSSYAPPLAKIAAELAARLERELAVCTGRASVAAGLEYTACAAYLMRIAPRVYEVLAEIRGLALVKNPDLATELCSDGSITRVSDGGDKKDVLPGEVLVYETLRLPALSAP